MNSQSQQCHQVTLSASTDSASFVHVKQDFQQVDVLQSKVAIDCPPVVEDASACKILQYLQNGHLLMVNSRRRNGLILCKSFYAEFAGPGAAVGGVFDQDCQQVIPVGKLSLIQPNSHEERHQAYLIRRQWIRLTQQFTDQSVPLQRAQMILNQFENYFDQDTIARIPDESFALLVGVLPYSVRMARRRPGKLNVKVKT